MHLASDQPRLDDTPSTAPNRLALPGELERVICAYSWDCDTALRVAWCESEWREDAVSAYGHRGIYQIAPVHIPRIEAMGYTWDDMLLAGPNVAVAYALWLEQGWSPWICR